VICGEPEPPESVVEEAKRNQAPLFRLGHDFSAHRKGRMVEFQWKGKSWDLPLPAMRGEHQVANMATSVAALLEVLPETADQMDSITRGLQEVVVSGRMQQLCRSPLVLIDVGHNPLAARAVAQAIDEASHIRPGGECRCVFGMLRDKDAAEVAAILHPLVSAWYCAGLTGERGRSGVDLSSHVLAVEQSARVVVCNDVETAFTQALEDSSPNDCVLVFGSFLTAAAAIAHWKSHAAALVGTC